jgi:addiction module RelE/StbE family toxin
MRVKWLRGALQNLHQAVHYIAQDNPIAASNVAESIWETVAQLEQYPHMGRPGRLKGTRELVVPRLPYIIRYRIKTEIIESCVFITWHNVGLKEINARINTMLD